MKKKLISGVLAACLLAGSCSAAFTDIKTPELGHTATVLKALGVMSGDSDTVFAPSRQLTRAEFARLAVSALGVTDVTAYKSFTIFPDVPSTHWAAGYINAAVRHPEISKKGILHGYADGTFGPDRTISCGEACTMLLLMLGYTVDDIGPMWPGDYIARARSLGLTDGAAAGTAGSAVTRGDAAVMLLNTLRAAGKDGERLISQLTSSSDSESAILLATSRTDSSLRSNQARFYTGGEDTVVKTTDTVLDDSLIGLRGTLYYCKEQPGTVLTLLPDKGARVETYAAERAERDRIEVKEGGMPIRPERDTLLYNRGQVRKFSESWFDIQPGDQISLHYDKDGALALIRVTAVQAAENTFIYGTKQAASIPAGFAIEKNGVAVDASKLRPYDVVSLDTAGKRAQVSDAKVTGYYNEAEPSFKNPEKITLLGRTYPISRQAAASFASLQNGDRITLLLDNRGAVAAAYPAAEVRGEMTGVFGKMADGSAQVTLFNGAVVSGPLAQEDDKKLLGKAVLVTQNSSGTLSLSETALKGRPAGDWSVRGGTLGDKKVSQTVRVWEQVDGRAPLYETTLSALPFDTIARKDIRAVVTDSVGQVIALVLGDVTGDAWNYGYGWVSSKGGDDGTQDEMSAGLRMYDYAAGAQTTMTYQLIGRPSGVTGGPIGFPKGAENYPGRQALATRRLNRVAEAKLEDFDGKNGVRTAEGYYPLAEEVQVYLSDQRRFITLDQARADYSRFMLYAERKPEEGGKIRLITVS